MVHENCEKRWWKNYLTASWRRHFDTWHDSSPVKPKTPTKNDIRSMCCLLYGEFIKYKWEQKRFLFCFDFFWVMLTSHVSYHKHNMSFQLVNFTYPNAPCAVVTAANTSISLFSLVYSSFSFQFVVFFQVYAYLVPSHSYYIYNVPFGWKRTNRYTQGRRECVKETIGVYLYLC